MNTKIRPGVVVLVIIAACGIIFGIMWSQSEAPRLNRLPHPMAMGAPAKTAPPGPSAKPSSPAKQNSPHPTASPSAKSAPAGSNS